MKAALEIRVGKTYLTRGGSKITILAIGVRHAQYSVIGLLAQDYKEEHPVSLTSEGRYYIDGEHHKYDLVKEYVEPPKPREVWINDYGSLGDLNFQTKEQADLSRGGGGRAVLFREVLPE